MPLLPLNVPDHSDIMTLAAALRQRSTLERLRRPFTLAESIVVALVARGATYRQAAAQYGAAVPTVATHARVAADKILDAVVVEPELARLPPKLRLFLWARKGRTNGQ